MELLLLTYLIAKLPDVYRPFLTYLHTYHVRRFLPYNVRYLGAFLDPLPTLVLDVIYGRSLFPFM